MFDVVKEAQQCADARLMQMDAGDVCMLDHSPSAAPQSCSRLSTAAAEPSPPPDLVPEVNTLNSESMQLLREGKMQDALELLTRAQAHLDRMGVPSSIGTDRERALLSAHADTASNLGVYHRKAGEHGCAVHFLQRALKFHKALNAGPRALVAAHLNLAVCCLESGASPVDSLRNAQAAVELGGQMLASSPDKGGGDLSPDDCAMLAVAYHKVAEAHEASREWAQASHAYTQAYEVVRHTLGRQHHLTKAFEKSSRCPRLVATSARIPRSPVPSAPQPLRRLPSISRPRQASGQQRKYQLSPEIFAPWPPKNSSDEEHRWYSMERRR